MINLETKSLNNIRHLSIRKKTASRICSTQVLYEASFLINEIDIIIEYYLKNDSVRISIAKKGFERAIKSGYEVEDKTQLIIEKVNNYMKNIN